MQISQSRSRFKKSLILIIVLIALTAATFTVWLLYIKPNHGSNAPPLPSDQPTAKITEAIESKEPNCPDEHCISVTVNGDLLFHALLWNGFRVNDEREFDFLPLFAAQQQYYDKTDLAICDLETPIASSGGPYADYPIFNIPPQVLDAAYQVGYRACTTATNHSFDQGSSGILRMTDKLDELGIAHTGVYGTESQSDEPLIIDLPVGRVAIVGATVSLNGFTPDYDWQIDRLRQDENRTHDIEKITSKARKAKEQGAQIVLLQLHSVQEYITYADSWQISAAHELADTGLFDFIYFHGSHSVQPIEIYNDIYIAYGVGNSVTVTAIAENWVNDQGLTLRAQFASTDGQNYKLSKLSYLPTFNKTGGQYAWCPLASDRPSGFCTNETKDNEMFTRMKNILYSMNVPSDGSVLSEWLISTE